VYFTQWIKKIEQHVALAMLRVVRKLRHALEGGRVVEEFVTVKYKIFCSLEIL